MFEIDLINLDHLLVGFMAFCLLATLIVTNYVIIYGSLAEHSLINYLKVTGVFLGAICIFIIILYIIGNLITAILGLF